MNILGLISQLIGIKTLRLTKMIDWNRWFNGYVEKRKKKKREMRRQNPVGDKRGKEWLVEIDGLMGMKKIKIKSREGDEGAKPYGRWRGEGEWELEIKACERETERGEVRWNYKRRWILIWQYLGRLKKNSLNFNF